MATDDDPTLDDSYFFDQLNEDIDPLEADDADEFLDSTFADLLSNDYSNSPDLYAVLGIPKDATLADIRAAYKKYSLLLHPDRHVNTSNEELFETSRIVRADAEVAFGRVCTAYNILSDPEKRNIYDRFGHEGLDMKGWAIVGTQKSDPELRMEYLMLKQKAEAEKHLQLTQPSSGFSLGLDLTDLFDRYLQESPKDRYLFPVPRINEVNLTQSISSGVTSKDTVNLAGQVTSFNGLGRGSCFLLWRHYRGKSRWFGFTTIDSEVNYGRYGQRPSLGLRVRRAFGDRHVGYFGAQLACDDKRKYLSLVPGACVGWQMQLFPRTVARVECRWNLEGGLNSDLLWSSIDEKYSARLSAFINVQGRLGVTVRVERAVPWSWLNFPRNFSKTTSETREAQSVPEWAKLDEEAETQHSEDGRIFSSIDVNNFDLVEFTVGANCAVSSYSNLIGSFSFSYLRGVNLRFSLRRGTQTYSIPILLSNYANFVAAGYGLLVPGFLFGLIRTLIYEPYWNKQLERAQLARRKKLKTELAKRRHEALSTQALMKHSADRAREMESSISGLIIEQAIYGLLPSSHNGNDKIQDVGGPMNFDVTIPIQTLVEKSQLRLPPGRWSDLQGFYDPCLGIYKAPVASDALRQLRVVYTFRGDLHEVTTTETQGLAVPMSKHQIATQ